METRRKADARRPALPEKPETTIWVQTYGSPCGELLLGSFGESLCLCDWRNERHRGIRGPARTTSPAGPLHRSPVASARRGSPSVGRVLRRIPPDIRHSLSFAGTEFQKTVWRALLAIPFGATVSYGELARRIGQPKAVRAVANANGANPLSIFVPCHRVIGSDRSLTGYGGGLAAKRWLLELESEPLLPFRDTFVK